MIAKLAVYKRPRYGSVLGLLPCFLLFVPLTCPSVLNAIACCDALHHVVAVLACFLPGDWLYPSLLYHSRILWLLTCSSGVKSPASRLRHGWVEVLCLSLSLLGILFRGLPKVRSGHLLQDLGVWLV